MRRSSKQHPITDNHPDAAETDKLFPRTEAVEGGQPLEWRGSIRPAVDFGSQKVKFLIQALFGDLDPPEFGTAVGGRRSRDAVMLQTFDLRYPRWARKHKNCARLCAP